MNYWLIHQQEVIGFTFFFEAWLYAKLDLNSWSQIYGPDGESWTVSPYNVN
jgi:hypothetical protein